MNHGKMLIINIFYNSFIQQCINFLPIHKNLDKHKQIPIFAVYVRILLNLSPLIQINQQVTFIFMGK